jgi:spore coat polysaccharide biosynthesis protein SpsF
LKPQTAPLFSKYKYKPSVLAIVQARMSSSRLPGKVLLDIGGQPMLARVVERAQRAQSLSGILVATTTEASDDPIEQLCAERGYPCFRGSLSDVLDRYYQAARTFHADIIVRLTADCPVIDADVIDLVVGIFGIGKAKSNKAVSPKNTHLPIPHFAANRLPVPWSRTLPIGLDVEVVTFAALERAWQEADQPFQREHVMPYFYEGLPAQALQPPQEAQAATPTTYSVLRTTSPRGFQVAQLHHFPDYGYYRWTVDTQADLELLRQVYLRFGRRDDFSWYDVVSLFEREPELAEINAGVEHKTAFDVG